MTEKMAWTIGGVVSLLTLMASAYVGGMTINNMSRDISETRDSIERMEFAVGEQAKLLKNRTELFKDLESNQSVILRDMVVLVYLGDSGEDVIFGTSDGRTFSVPLSKKKTRGEG